jgi:hypothetical protein
MRILFLKPPESAFLLYMHSFFQIFECSGFPLLPFLSIFLILKVKTVYKRF